MAAYKSVFHCLHETCNVSVQVALHWPHFALGAEVPHKLQAEPHVS